MKLTQLSVIISALAAQAVAAEESKKVRGVSSSKQHLYTPDKNNKWKCLGNPEIEIDFDKINDDYCDCPDGSDEPGTSACEKGKFFCENAGFKPSYIPSFKVNDGVCDYEVCCDGSDEWNTDANCENKCAELNENYQAFKKSKINTLTQGLNIKNQWLSNVAKDDELLLRRINDESMHVGQLSDEVYQLKKKVEELNKDFNEEAMKFINELKTEHNHSEIDQKIYNLKEAVKLIRLGVDRNDEKVQTARGILEILSNDFDQNINDVTVKKAIEEFQAFEKEDKYDEFDTLYKAYMVKYDGMLKDLDLYNIYFFLEKNKEHLANWKNFIWTRKTTLHSALLKLLLLQDETTKTLEAIMDDIKDNYNPNFNNDVVKNALKKIEEYGEMKEEIQENVLGKIDYANDYNQAIKDFIALLDNTERAIGRKPKVLKDLEIDEELNEEQLTAKREAIEKEKADRQRELELQETPVLIQIKETIIRAVEDFLGVYDNIPVKKDPVFESVAYDLVANKLDEINDLSNGGGDESDNEYSGQLKKLNADILSKQKLILDLNEEVSTLVEELNDSTGQFGPGKVLKAIENETFKAPIGEYEYEINFLGSIKQVGNGQNSLIGNYNGKIQKVDTKDGKKLVMNFDNGARCWNGPIRQAVVNVFCGEKVEILKVTEPEVCQYFMEVTSPIACFEEELEEVKQEEKVEEVEEPQVEEPQVEESQVEESQVEEPQVEESHVEKQTAHDEL